MIGSPGQGLADCPDAPVHHVARGDDVRAGIDVAHGGAGEQVERLVVLDLSVAEDTAVAMARVLAEADVGDEREGGNLGPQRPQRALHDPVGVPGARPLLVLLLRDSEEQHGPHPE